MVEVLNDSVAIDLAIYFKLLQNPKIRERLLFISGVGTDENYQLEAEKCDPSLQTD